MPDIPWAEMWLVFRYAVPAALGASLVVALVIRLIGGERLMPLAAALAVAAGVFAANHFHNAIERWELHPTRAWTALDFVKVMGRSLEEKPEAENVDDPNAKLPLPQPKYWLPLLAALAMIVEVLVSLPGVPPAAGCIARTAVSLLAARLMIPAVESAEYDWRLTKPWLTWGLGLVIALEWSIMAALSKVWKDGTVATAMVFCLAAVSILAEWEASTGSFAAIALYLSVAILPVAVLGWFKPGDNGPALAAAAIMIPGLLQLSYYGHSGETPLPLSHFLLVGLAPLTLALMFLPFFIAGRSWQHWLPAIVLPLIPAGLAVYFAMQMPADATAANKADLPTAAVE
ncbi:MAG TPA: hypothetical protein VE988_03310 [Gemmataceae bacterium]|nr:hypothetical protein [Gemmataceae bacterium]